MDIKTALEERQKLTAWARQANAQELRDALRSWREEIKTWDAVQSAGRWMYLNMVVVKACQGQHAKQEAVEDMIERWVMLEKTDSPHLIEKYLNQAQEKNQMTVLPLLNNPNVTGGWLARATRIARDKEISIDLDVFKKQERFGGACDYQFLKKHGFPAADIEKTETVKALEANWEGTLGELLKAAEELGPQMGTAEK